MFYASGGGGGKKKAPPSKETLTRQILEEESDYEDLESHHSEEQLEQDHQEDHVDEEESEGEAEFMMIQTPAQGLPSSAPVSVSNKPAVYFDFYSPWAEDAGAPRLASMLALIDTGAQSCVLSRLALEKIRPSMPQSV